MPVTMIRQARVLTPVGTVTRVENHGPDKLKGGWSIQGGRTYTNQLKIETSSRYVGPIQIIQSLALKFGDHYAWPLSEYNGRIALPAIAIEEDTGSFIQNIQLEPDGDDGRQWIMTLEYGPYDYQHEKGDDQGGTADPLTQKPEVSWGTAKFEESRPEDSDGQPYLNTVGDPLEDPPAHEESRPVLTITRNEPQYNEVWVNQFVDHVNSDPFLGWAMDTVKCKDIVGKRVWDKDWGYHWEVSYEFEFRPEGWTSKLLNAGYRELDGSGDPQMVLVSGAPVSSPVALTEAGHYDPDASPFFLEFREFEHADFDFLNIPEDILTASE